MNNIKHPNNHTVDEIVYKMNEVQINKYAEK